MRPGQLLPPNSTHARPQVLSELIREKPVGPRLLPKPKDIHHTIAKIYQEYLVAPLTPRNLELAKVRRRPKDV